MSTQEGVLTECQGANFMLVDDGRIKLPDRSNVLHGISMETVLELAQTLDIPVDEGEYSTYDAYEAMRHSPLAPATVCSPSRPSTG